MLNVQSGAAGVRVAESHFGLVWFVCFAQRSHISHHVWLSVRCKAGGKRPTATADRWQTPQINM